MWELSSTPMVTVVDVERIIRSRCSWKLICLRKKAANEFSIESSIPIGHWMFKKNNSGCGPFLFPIRLG